MKIKYFSQLIILFLFVFKFNIAEAVQIPVDQAEEWTRQTGEKIVKILTSVDNEKKYNEIDEIITKYVDVEYIAKFSIGKYWKQMTKEQQKKYEALFQRYMFSMYRSFPLNIEAGAIDFSIDKSIADKDYTNVFCVVSYDNTLGEKSEENLSVNTVFMLIKDNENIKIRDIKINESSLLLKIREHIYKLIKEDDDEITWFLEDFETIVSDNEKKYRY